MQKQRHVLWLHGLSGVGRGVKSDFLATRLARYPWIGFHRVEFNPTPDSFRAKTVSGMIERLHAYLREHDLDEVDVVASSLGSLVALHYARRHGGIRRMVMLAPLLAYLPPASFGDTLCAWEADGSIEVEHAGFGRKLPLDYGFHLDALRYAQPVPPPVPAIILHGRRDALIPPFLSAAYAAAYSQHVDLVEVDADHDMVDALDDIWSAIAGTLLDEPVSNAS